MYRIVSYTKRIKTLKLFRTNFNLFKNFLYKNSNNAWKGRVYKKNKEPVYNVPIESTDLRMQYYTKTSRFRWIYCFKIKKRP